MEATHQQSSEDRHAHEQQHEREHHDEHQHERPHEDWFDEDFVAEWLRGQAGRADERHSQFVKIRAVVPKAREDAFRYINLGAGGGHLDEVLLEHFPAAEALLVDGSLAMLAEARKRLERFEGRVELVQANLASPDWIGAVQGPFDVGVSSIALHNLRDPRRLRELYAEVYTLIGHGGVFLNLDYVRLARPGLSPLVAWAAKDPEAGFNGRRGGPGLPGTVEEQCSWLHEGGFAVAECFWREFNVALIGALRDHLHLPEAEHEQHGHDEHAHADHGHDDHDHAHADAAHGDDHGHAATESAHHGH